VDKGLIEVVLGLAADIGAIKPVLFFAEEVA
jgi:hypothetical protein